MPNEFNFKATIFPVNLPEADNLANVDSWRWTILDFEILVFDYEIGCGSSMIHSAQKALLLTLCQAQIRQSPNVLNLLDFIIFCLGH